MSNGINESDSVTITIRATFNDYCNSVVSTTVYLQENDRLVAATYSNTYQVVGIGAVPGSIVEIAPPVFTTNTNAYSYQWYQREAGSSQWSTIVGATNKDLIFTDQVSSSKEYLREIYNLHLVRLHNVCLNLKYSV